jgi:hypothetical protein
MNLRRMARRAMHCGANGVLLERKLKGQSDMSWTRSIAVGDGEE